MPGQTLDANQIIDRSSEVDGLLIATGYSGHGFLMGPATGEIIRDLYLGQEPGYDISPFTLDRFADVDVERGETNISDQPAGFVHGKRRNGRDRVGSGVTVQTSDRSCPARLRSEPETWIGRGRAGGSEYCFSFVGSGLTC
jgi:FAD dependent oxidoreductase